VSVSARAMEQALVIHPGALGDVLLAIPALRALRGSPEARAVTLAAQPGIGSLMMALGVVDRAIAFDTLGIDTLFTDAALRADAPVAREVAATSRVVCWFGARDEHFTSRLRALAPGAVVAPPARGPAVWQHLLESVGAPARAVDAGVVPTSVDVTPITVASRDLDAGRSALRAAGWDGHSRLLIVHPGAGGATKRWPAEGFAEILATALRHEPDVTLVVHEGPADATAVEDLRKLLKLTSLHLAHPSLATLAGALSLAAAYVGNDSGVSHLAAAVGTRSLVLFTEPLRPWLPWSHSATCLTIDPREVIATERAAIAAALARMMTMP